MAKKDSALKGGVSNPYTPPPYGFDESPYGYLVPAPAPASTPVVHGGTDLAAERAARQAGKKDKSKGGGNGRGGGVATAPAPLTWDNKYTVDGAPSWWQGLVPSALTPDTAYLGIINDIIPYLSPEDQQAMAGSLYRANPDAFGAYNPETLTIAPPVDLTTGTINQFNSADRGNAVLTALAKFATASGQPETALGPGYNFLRSVADAMRDYGGVTGEGQTRTQALQLKAALDPILAETKDPSLSAFEPLARALATPFFSAGNVTPVTRAADGSYIFGEANQSLY